MSAITDSLIKAGFEPSVAEIYTILVESGELSVGQIVEKSKLSRAGAYDALNLLLAQSFVEYRKEGRNAFYSAVHPDKLYGLVEEKKRESALLEDEMKNAIKSLTGAFNLTQNKPGVRFFEGEEGLKEALFHSLEAEDIIYTFADSKTIDAYAKGLDEEYVQQRMKKGIKKRIIMTDTPESRDYISKMDKTYTEAKLIDPLKHPFTIATEVYNNHVSYLTTSKDRGEVTAFLITHPQIAQFQKTIFEFVWNSLPEFKKEQS